MVCGQNESLRKCQVVCGQREGLLNKVLELFKIPRNHILTEEFTPTTEFSVDVCQVLMEKRDTGFKTLESPSPAVHVCSPAQMPTLMNAAFQPLEKTHLSLLQGPGEEFLGLEKQEKPISLKEW